MSIITILRERVFELEQSYRWQIEERFEPVYEDTRKESFDEELAADSGAIRRLSDIDRETERLKQNKALKKGEQIIRKLWQRFLRNLAIFQLLYDFVIIIDIVFGITSALVGLIAFSFWFLVVALLLILISRLDDWHFVLACYLSGGRQILDKLFDEYREYGQNEAKLRLADPRKLSCSNVQTTYIFTTLKRISPS